MTPDMLDGPIVAITDRTGFDESFHHGIAVGLGVDGDVVTAIGAVDEFVYPRSSNKPMQAAAMLRAGWEPDSEQLALACASHDGTERHVSIARSTLEAAGLDEAALQNTPDLPLDRASSRSVLAAGGGPAPVLMNCSGKHAAMVATCQINGWPLDSYLDVEHPLQLAITAEITEMVGDVPHIGVDGCGAPAHVMSLVALARAFRAVAMRRGRIWAAMTAHPELVGGDDRDDTHLMRRIPGLIAKGGAEGVMAAALPDGRAVAVKILDGNGRAAGVVAGAVLAAGGVDVDLDGIGPPMLGHGRPVGRVRAVIGGA